jgi:hypothetical protein
VLLAIREGEPTLNATPDRFGEILSSSIRIVNGNRRQTNPLFLGSEALAILAGDDEGLDHLGVDKVAVELVEFV